MNKEQALEEIRKRGYKKGMKVNGLCKHYRDEGIITCAAGDITIFSNVNGFVNAIYGAEHGYGGPQLYNGSEWASRYVENLNVNTKVI